MDVVDLDETAVGRMTLQPGWRWSESVRPIVGGDSCQTHHVGYAISGRMHVLMDDGQEMDVGPGEAIQIPPGHDAWVVGEEPCVVYDFAGGATEYAKAKGQPLPAT